MPPDASAETVDIWCARAIPPARPRDAIADRFAADCCLGGPAMRVTGNALMSGLRGRDVCRGFRYRGQHSRRLRGPWRTTLAGTPCRCRIPQYPVVIIAGSLLLLWGA
jgi:hypothetical protein